MVLYRSQAIEATSRQVLQDESFKLFAGADPAAALLLPVDQVHLCELGSLRVLLVYELGLDLWQVVAFAFLKARLRTALKRRLHRLRLRPDVLDPSGLRPAQLMGSFDTLVRFFETDRLQAFVCVVPLHDDFLPDAAPRELGWATRASINEPEVVGAHRFETLHIWDAVVADALFRLNVDKFRLLDHLSRQRGSDAAPRREGRRFLIELQLSLLGVLSLKTSLVLDEGVALEKLSELFGHLELVILVLRFFDQLHKRHQ